ncbi:MAG: hypothetical protein JZU55_08115, partial [Afipia sp.]|nr:hypothetical protein [Afipia sp.]
ESDKPEPNKYEIGKALDRALTYAEKTTGFAEAVEKLAPHVSKAVAWLGSHWHYLLPIVGLTL